MYPLVIGILIAALVINTYILVITFRRNRSDKRFFLVLSMALILIVTLGHLIEVTARDVSGAFAGVKIYYFGYSFLSPLFLLFSIDYCRVRLPKKLHVAVTIALLAVSAALTVIVWTSDRHSIFYAESPRTFDASHPYRGLRTTPGPLYPIVPIYSIICVFFILMILLKRMYTGSMYMRRVYRIFTATAIVPIVFNLTYIAGLYQSTSTAFTMSFTPMALTMLIVVVHVAVLRFGLFDTVQFAYSAVLGDMSDAIIITDPELEWLDSNPVALKLFPGIEKYRDGIPVTNAENWPQKLFGPRSQALGTVVEITLSGSEEPRAFSVTHKELREKERLLGHAFVFKDITDSRRLMEQMQTVTSIDSLTGLYNRRHFLELAGKEFNRATRLGFPCYAMIFEIDRFSSIGDEFGNRVSDAVLYEISKRVNETLRSYDLFARYSGEEFAVLLEVITDTDDKVAYSLAERVRTAVAKSPVMFEGIEIPLTLSIGLASKKLAGSLEELLLHADYAMYAAKESGRNRVCVYTQK